MFKPSYLVIIIIYIYIYYLTHLQMCLGYEIMLLNFLKYRTSTLALTCSDLKSP